MSLLDLSAKVATIKFDKNGGIVGAIFWYFNPDDTPIDLTGYNAVGEIKATYDSPTNLLDLSSQGVSPALSVISQTFTTAAPYSYQDEDYVTHVIPKPPVASAVVYGVKLTIPNTQTSTFTWTKAYFEIRLVPPSGAALPFVKGNLVMSVSGGICNG